MGGTEIAGFESNIHLLSLQIAYFVHTKLGFERVKGGARNCQRSLEHM